VREKEMLVRFVIGPDGAVVPDPQGRLPGRGFWLSAERDAIARACRRNLFQRAAGRPVSVPGDLVERVGRLLRRRCLERLGLARRAGELVLGFEKVSAWLAGRRAAGALLLAARDGAADGRTKIARQAPGLAVVDAFTGEELGRALGRERVVHALITPGRQAAALALEVGRLSGLEAGA
jgi:predicted RNA-binding protein YlxR (DUF448 family)